MKAGAGVGTRAREFSIHRFGFLPFEVMPGGCGVAAAPFEFRAKINYGRFEFARVFGPNGGRMMFCIECYESVAFYYYDTDTGATIIMVFSNFLSVKFKAVLCVFF